MHVFPYGSPHVQHQWQKLHCSLCASLSTEEFMEGGQHFWMCPPTPPPRTLHFIVFQSSFWSELLVLILTAFPLHPPDFDQSCHSGLLFSATRSRSAILHHFACCCFSFFMSFWACYSGIVLWPSWHQGHGSLLQCEGSDWTLSLLSTVKSKLLYYSDMSRAASPQ